MLPKTMAVRNTGDDRRFAEEAFRKGTFGDDFTASEESTFF